MKSFFRILMFAFIGLILAMALFPYVFKERILNEIKRIAEEHVQAQVNFEDINLSLFRSFPHMNIKVESLEISGLDTFENKVLFACDAFDFDMNIKPLFNKDATPEIQFIGIDKPELNIITLKDGRSNYDIFNSNDEETTPFQIELKSYEIINGKITYKDYSNTLNFALSAINHHGKGDFSQNIFDINSQTEAIIDYLFQDGNKYLEEVRTQWNGVVNINQSTNTYAFKENNFELSKLKIDLTGKIQMLDEDVVIDLKFNTPSNSVENLLSVLPFIQQDIPVSTRGDFNLTGQVKGYYNDEQDTYPTFSILAGIDNGFVKYEGFQFPVEDINGKIQINSPTQKLENLSVILDGLRLKIQNDKIEGSLKITEFFLNPYFEGAMNGDINLSNWANSVPLKDIDDMSGILNFDLNFEAGDKDIRSENYNNIKLSGLISGSSIHIESKNNDITSVNTVSIGANEQWMDVEFNDLQYNEAHFNITSQIKNPINLLSSEYPLIGNITVQSKYIDLNKFSNVNSEDEVSSLPNDEVVIAFMDFKIDARIDKIRYQDYLINDLAFQGVLNEALVDIQNLKLNIENSDLAIKGSLKNLNAYLNNTGVLHGDIYLASSLLDLNAFMVDTSESTELIRIPKDLDLIAISDIKELIYDNLRLTNSKGIIHINNGAFELREVDANLLGGQIVFDARYDSAPDQPAFDSKIDLSKIQFSSAFENFTFFKKVTPLIQYIDGFFNSTLVFSGSLLKDMTPNYNTLDATGYIETLNSSIKNAEPLEKIAEKLSIKELKSLALENTKNWFELRAGTFILKERDLRINGINSVVSGTHQIDGKINYELTMELPKSLLSGSAIGQGVDLGIKFIEEEAKKIGINIQSGEFVDVKVVIGNTLKSPTIRIIPLGTSGESVESELNQKAEETIQYVKDTINATIQKKKEELEDTLKSKLNEEVDKAKEKIEEKAKEETDKVLDKAKDKASEILDTTLTKAVSDSLKSKIDEALKNKGAKDMEDIIKDWDIFKKKKKNK